MRVRSSLLALGLLACTSLAHADSIFNFEGVASGTSLPLSLTNSGLTANFSGQATVCATGDIFSTLSGNVLIQQFCGSSNEFGPINIAFSRNLSSLTFDFATAGATAPITVDLFEGFTLVGVDTFTSAFPTDLLNGEGVATLSGLFNSISITDTTTQLAIDNLDARALAPEPSSLLLLGTGALGLLGAARRRFQA